MYKVNKVKCTNCKYYMKMTYTNGKGGVKTFCLKLNDILSASVVITDCNQFESNIDINTKHKVKT